MIRVVLAVALAVALLGVSLAPAERAERDRNAAVATGELETVADRADRLAAENDPVEGDQVPASTTLAVEAPTSTLTDGGRLRLDDDLLVWEPATGPIRRVDADAPLRVESPLVVADRARLRLSLVAGDGGGGNRSNRSDRIDRTNRTDRTDHDKRDDHGDGLGDGRAVVRIDRVPVDTDNRSVRWRAPTAEEAG